MYCIFFEIRFQQDLFKFLMREVEETVVIIDCENANITYCREHNSITAILKEKGAGMTLDKVFPKIEYAFSRYNARYLISDCSIISEKIKSSLYQFVKNLIKTRIEKIAFVGENGDCGVNFREIETLTNCETRIFPCHMTAQAWIQKKDRELS